MYLKEFLEDPIYLKWDQCDSNRASSRVLLISNYLFVLMILIVQRNYLFNI
jgi:hypothetical protein